METKMSAKIKWAIALLLIRVLGAFSTGLDTARMFGVTYDYSHYFVFSALYEQLPTIAAVVLIFYNHKQPKTENTGFTLMQKWIFALVWVQHAYAFISFALADSLTSVWTKILSGCVWLGVITYLLYSAWKNPVAVEEKNEQATTVQQAETTSPKDIVIESPYNEPTDKSDEIDPTKLYPRAILLLSLGIVLIIVLIAAMASS